jgi:transcriptional regulator GlxA family with amidase domain
LDYASIHTVREVAQASSVSDGYLRHIFKKRFGIGIKRRLNQIRILRACDLLSGSTLAIKVIAHLCGFDNDRHFSTCFHTEMACSPGDYRRLGGDCQRKS